MSKRKPLSDPAGLRLGDLKETIERALDDGRWATWADLGRDALRRLLTDPISPGTMGRLVQCARFCKLSVDETIVLLLDRFAEEIRPPDRVISS